MRPTHARRDRSNARREHGAAMMLVMVFLTLSLIALTLLFDRTRLLFAFQEQAARITGTENGVEKALGIAIARMRSGVPGESPFSCQISLRDEDGSNVEIYHVIHTEIATDRWTLEAFPSGSEIDDCPALFTTSCPVSP
jgi:hypothetical protein